MGERRDGELWTRSSENYPGLSVTPETMGKAVLLEEQQEKIMIKSHTELSMKVRRTIMMSLQIMEVRLKDNRSKWVKTATKIPEYLKKKKAKYNRPERKIH